MSIPVKYTVIVEQGYEFESYFDIDDEDFVTWFTEQMGEQPSESNPYNLMRGIKFYFERDSERYQDIIRQSKHAIDAHTAVITYDETTVDRVQLL